jgi:hypothetical protein
LDRFGSRGSLTGIESKINGATAGSPILVPVKNEFSIGAVTKTTSALSEFIFPVDDAGIFISDVSTGMFGCWIKVRGSSAGIMVGITVGIGGIVGGIMEGIGGGGT